MTMQFFKHYLTEWFFRHPLDPRTKAEINYIRFIAPDGVIISFKGDYDNLVFYAE